MRVLLRAVSTRDVSRTDGGRLPGLNLGDTVFAIPGPGTTLEAQGAGWNFYDYVLDGQDPALKNGEESVSVRADQLTAADNVYPLRTRLLVQRPVRRPGGGGTEFGPEESLGEFNLRPGAGSALVDAVGEEDPAGTPYMMPVVVNELDESTGTAYATQIFGESSIVGKPLKGSPLSLPVTAEQALPDLKSYSFTLPFDSSVVALTGVSDGNTLTPDVSTVTFTNAVEGNWAEGSLSGPNNPQFTLLNLRARLLDALSGQTLSFDTFELRDASGAALGVTSPSPTVSGSKGDWVTIPIEVDLGTASSSVTKADVAAYSFRIEVPDPSKLAITGVDVDNAATAARTELDFTSEVEVSWSKSNGAVTGTGPLVHLQARMMGAGAAGFAFDSVTLTDTNGKPVNSPLTPPSDVRAEGAGDLTGLSIPLEGGSDGQVPTSYETESSGSLPPDDPEGFDALEDLENVSIVAAPSYTAIEDEAARLSVQGELISHCADMKYRIAVLETPPGSTVKEARDWRGNIDSTYAALYYPWVTIFDPLTRSELNVPPSGHVAGIYARNDIQNGVHKAPANEVVRSAVGFETRINKAQQDVLNPEGVNCFRFFEGRGNRLWGARLATSDNEYKYVNIRRYLAYLERSIDQGTQVFVFENNGTDLWRNVRRTIGSFLKNEWRSDRLMGTTPEQAYFVKCDRSTMTQNDIDNGRLICEIGVALFRPAEFVIFRIGQKLLSDTG
ncbi:MAG: phage tail sheath subtilisin-like domain-containing protein [Salinibacter sp.]